MALAQARVEVHADANAPSLGEQVDIGYLGMEYDSLTGRYENRGRFYDPSGGRFLSPVDGEYLSGASNLYLFADNAPVDREVGNPAHETGWNYLSLFGYASQATRYIPGMGPISLALGIAESTAQEAQTVWSNSSHFTAAGRLGTTVGTVLGSFTGVRQLSDWGHGADAVDGHVQSGWENGIDLVLGSLGVVGTVFGGGAISKALSQTVAGKALNASAAGQLVHANSTAASQAVVYAARSSLLGSALFVNAAGYNPAIINGVTRATVEIKRFIPLRIPQGLTPMQFDRISAKVRAKADQLGLGSDIVVQGSRAGGYAGATSDLDIAIRVSHEKFNSFINNPKLSTLGKSNLCPSDFRTRLHAIESGKIQAGEAGLSQLRKVIQNDLGILVDISVIRRGSAFDSYLQTPLSFGF